MRAEKRSSCCGTIKELIASNPIFPANKSPCPYLTQVHLLHFFTYFCFYLFLFLFCFVLFFFWQKAITLNSETVVLFKRWWNSLKPKKWIHSHATTPWLSWSRFHLKVRKMCYITPQCNNLRCVFKRIVQPKFLDFFSRRTYAPFSYAKECWEFSLNFTLFTKKLSLQSQLNQLVSLTEYFRRDLEIAGLSKALDNLTAHENENVKKRALIILTRIKAQKLVEQE